jgi:glycosyl transferase family 2
MLISVGILAWNEAQVIGSLLESLFRQTALTGADELTRAYSWEIVVVPNGCSDNTAEISRRVLEEQIASIGRTNVVGRVMELTEAGKSNAWNQYVHSLSSATAELIVMVDADIEFGETQTLANTVRALLEDPRAHAAVDLPLKDAVKKTRRSLVERVSLAGSGAALQGPPGLSGQFFCARSAVLRGIWMPKGMSVEDGYIGAMLRTDCMLSQEDHRRIIRAPGATHYYETLTSLRSIFHHELRLVMGTALNCYLIWDFLLFATDPRGAGAGVLMRNLLERDPHWYAKLMANSIRARGWWVLPQDMLFRRFGNLAHRRGLRWLRALAVALVGFLLDLPIFLVANHWLKKQRAIGFW